MVYELCIVCVFPFIFIFKVIFDKFPTILYTIKSISFRINQVFKQNLGFLFFSLPDCSAWNADDHQRFIVIAFLVKVKLQVFIIFSLSG